MPARLADGLGLESGLGSRYRAPFAPSSSRLEEFGSPASGFRKEVGFRLQRQELNTSAALCQIQPDLLKKTLPISALKRLIPQPFMARTRILSVFFWLMPAMFFAAGMTYVPTDVTPPKPPREFRGAWIAAVATNQDWPSKPGLPVAQQKAELIALLDRAAQLHLNAIIFQVRPACDALYASPIEPWSERITGTQGKAPQPFYDPLAFAIAEAHKRGLELHAWFNPFRATHPLAESRVALNHISKTHPELVRQYGRQSVLDAGEPAAREYVLRVVMDVVRRYDVDGVQFDDYFYPYPEKNVSGLELNFPDDVSWQKYGVSSGLSRDDWRRANVNQFIQSVYHSIKALKPWVKFGVSPFGIWRPGFPSQIKGLDTYAKIYADSRLWLANGWLDYCAPQLYWPIDQKEKSFPVLLQWWRAQNVRGRHVWPGLYDVSAGKEFSDNEIPRQIQIAREQSAGGEIHFHLRSITQNPVLADALRHIYSQPALIPASPWLDSIPPDKPKLTIGESRAGLRFQWESSGGEPTWLWVLQFRTNEVWTTEILPADQTSRTFFDSKPDVVSISAVDRVGNESEPAVLKKSQLVRIGKGMIISN